MTLAFQLDTWGSEVDTPATATWWAEDRLQSGPLATLAELPGNRLWVVEGERVFTTQVALPGRPGAWPQLAPYALEDDLAGDVDELHVALGAKTTLGVAVAVIARRELDMGLAACRAAGFTPDAAVADYLLLPRAPGAWTALLTPERALVRTGPQTGFAVERELLPTWLALAEAEAEAEPRELHLYGHQDPAALGDIGPPITWCGPGSPLALAAAEAPRLEGVIDLLQGPYGTAPRRFWGPWRVAAALAGLWCGVELTTQGLTYRALEAERQAQAQAMEALYRQAVPDAVRVVNPRAQLEGALAARGTAAEDGGFLPLIYHGGSVLKTFDDLVLEQLDYRAGQLSLALSGRDLARFDQLAAELRNRSNLAVEIQTRKRGDAVEAQVRLGLRP